MKKLLALTLFILLTACATDNPPRFIGYTQDILLLESEENGGETEPLAFDVFFRREGVNFAMYEPTEGAYAAAWISPDAGIRGFEYAAGMRHAVYVNEVYLGDDIDIAWLLHCISSLATPMFVVHPPENADVMDIPEIELAIILAQRLGSFNMPMFVVFYPEHDLMPAEFTILFRMVRNAFLAHAPTAAFVWAAPCYSATPQSAFYPGHFAADWVALPLLADWCAEEGFTDVMTGFEQFYAAFQEYKPIMVLPLGVSHFTRGDYSYRINEAAAEIGRIYAALENFPRVGLIAYADVLTLSRMYSDDFSVSREINLIRAYGEAASGLLSSLSQIPEENSRWVRSAHRGYFFDDEIFISKHTLENELQIPTTLHQPAQFDNEVLFPADVIRKNIFACQTRRVIFIYD
ncbi:MAG: hypothetical protein FWF80_07645 [Defluviitaleaceae bacterium]|nr:hypothetical protein [Defluviitaleaceae bacterium]